MSEILSGLSLGARGPSGWVSFLQGFARLLAAGWRYRLAHGFLSNIFQEMAFKQVVEQGAFPPVFHVRPLVRSNNDDEASAGASPLL
jgi:hypothetical protein